MTKKYYPMLTEMRRKKIGDMADPKARAVAFCGEILARQCLAELLDAPEFSFQLMCNADFKSAVGNYNAHIDIASCSDTVACAAAQGPVGVSLKPLRPFSFAEAQDLLSDAEVRAVYARSGYPLAELVNRPACDEENVMKLFALFASLKEAYFRATGRGFRANINKTKFLFNGEEIACSDPAYRVEWCKVDQAERTAVSVIEKAV